MKTTSEIEYLLEHAPRPAPPAHLLDLLEEQIQLPAPQPPRPRSTFSWRRIWIPLSALGAAGALAISAGISHFSGTKLSLEVSLVSASEDRAGTWGVFAPGLGDDNGNGVGIANDWNWRATLRLSQTKTIKVIEVEHETSKQIWTTVNPLHWPLVVFYAAAQLNHGYGQLLGPFKAGTHQLDLFGQINNRTSYGTILRIEFTDGTAVSARIPPSSITVGQAGEMTAGQQRGGRPINPATASLLIYGDTGASSPARLVVESSPQPLITCLNMLGCGRIAIEATGVPGQIYILESTMDLTAPVSWRQVATNTADSNGKFEFSDTKLTNVPACFYQLRTP
ncbi:MAG: hypothetical protein C5B50_16835 [Verrucomicrobia bacterium]|nr:MAG: hypothetical protein C5B50_16835 [Verrucomicrobiota bacterium]